MENQAPRISERELAERIIYLHDVVELGFRRLVNRLKSEGTDISKDTAFRLYQKYKSTQKADAPQEIVDDETKLLDNKIKEAERNVGLVKAKDEKRNQIAALMVQEADVSFERRTELFESKTALLDFAKKVLPAFSPAIWVKITTFCELEKIDLADALKESLGDQAQFEEIREDYRKRNSVYPLDQYLRFCIEEWLLQRKSEELEEETEDSEDDDTEIIIEVVDDQGYICVDIPWDEYEDEESEYIQIRA